MIPEPPHQGSSGQLRLTPPGKPVPPMLWALRDLEHRRLISPPKVYMTQSVAQIEAARLSNNRGRAIIVIPLYGGPPT